MRRATDSRAQRWAQWRFSIIGPLLAAPPEKGQLQEALQALADKHYKHPITGEQIRVTVPSLERWYYSARKASDPIAVLRRRPRRDLGTQPSLSSELRHLVESEYASHKHWSYQLLFDNITVVLAQRPELGPMPSYSSFARFMRANGLRRCRRKPTARPGEVAALIARDTREVRSFEVQAVHALWHLDFHTAKRKVVTSSGHLVAPLMLCIIDDHSRTVCHCQWYLGETTQHLVHGFCQALQKRGLPRALMSDNGSAMTAGEFTQGLANASIVHCTTLEYSPHQNGKQERFWGQVEGRLLAMLDGKADLTLKNLNDATQAWVELEYNRTVHTELGVAPIARLMDGPQSGRPCPDSETLRRHFTIQEKRRVRRTDGTVSIQGKRFELPSRYGTLLDVTVRYARWDLSRVWLIDPHTDAVLAAIYPLDLQRNAEGARRLRDASAAPASQEREPDSGAMAPLLAQLIQQYQAVGLPPAYLAFDEAEYSQQNDTEVTP